MPLLIFAACANKTKTETKSEEQITTATETGVQLTDAQMKNAGVETGKLEMKNISSVLKVNGGWMYLLKI